MSELASAPALKGMKDIGTVAGVHARLVPGLSILSVLVRKGQVAALTDKVEAGLGITLADAPKRQTGRAVTTLGIGPGRWLFIGADAFTAELAGLASLSDHSDGYAVFEVWGPDVRRALAKGVPVDLDPSSFNDDVAVTSISHIGAILWQSAPDRFAVAVFRSYAASFWHWLSASAAEFGLVVES